MLQQQPSHGFTVLFLCSLTAKKISGLFVETLMIRGGSQALHNFRDNYLSEGIWSLPELKCLVHMFLIGRRPEAEENLLNLAEKP